MIGLAFESLWARLTIIQISANQVPLWLLMQKHSEKSQEELTENLQNTIFKPLRLRIRRVTKAASCSKLVTNPCFGNFVSVGTEEPASSRSQKQIISIGVIYISKTHRSDALAPS
jgi:hypothetical protein